MNVCYYYLIVEPLISKYKDDSSVQPASLGVVNWESKDYKVCFFTNKNQLYMIRIDILNVPDETIPETDLEKIQTIKEHILSVLRLTYDHDVSFFPRAIWNFRKQGQEPSFYINIEQIINPNFYPNVEKIRCCFCHISYQGSNKTLFRFTR